MRRAGHPRDLLAAGGVYARLWEQQSGFVVSPSGSGSGHPAPARLAAIPIFAGVGKELLARLAARFTTMDVPIGQTSVRGGASAETSCT